MPLNEAKIWKRSNLTKEQKQQAENVIFGLERDAMAPSQLNQSEIETMRRLVAEHDNQAKTVNFDLNNPPKQAYVHQDFPRMVYHHGERAYKVVQNADELAAALEDGFEQKPYPNEVAPVEAGESEVKASEAEPKPKLAAKKKPGRKPKAEAPPAVAAE